MPGRAEDGAIAEDTEDAAAVLYYVRRRNSRGVGGHGSGDKNEVGKEPTRGDHASTNYYGMIPGPSWVSCLGAVWEFSLNVT